MRSENMYMAFKERVMVFKTRRGYIGKLEMVEDWDTDTGLPLAYSGYVTIDGRKVWNIWYDDGACLEPNLTIVHFFPEILCKEGLQG